MTIAHDPAMAVYRALAIAIIQRAYTDARSPTSNCSAEDRDCAFAFLLRQTDRRTRHWFLLAGINLMRFRHSPAIRRLVRLEAKWNRQRPRAYTRRRPKPENPACNLRFDSHSISTACSPISIPPTPDSSPTPPAAT